MSETNKFLDKQGLQQYHAAVMAKLDSEAIALRIGNQRTAVAMQAIDGSGKDCIAYAPFSFAVGEDTYAGGANSVAEGYNTQALGYASHAEGIQSFIETGADAAHAEGASSAYGAYAHGEGDGASAEGYAAHAEGVSHAAEAYSHAEGEQSEAFGIGSHVEGQMCCTMTDGAHAEGNQCTAGGMYSHAEGCNTTTGQDAEGAHAEGEVTLADGMYSHAEGSATYTGGFAAHAGGSNTIANGDDSFSHGNAAKAIANIGFATGELTVAGGYGYYYFAIDTENKRIYLCDEQYSVPVMGTAAEIASALANTTIKSPVVFGNFKAPNSPDYSDYRQDSENGYYININNIETYIGQVKYSSYHKDANDRIYIQYTGALGFDAINIKETELLPIDYSISFPEVPECGMYPIFTHTFTEGYGAFAPAYCSHAEGYRTISMGEYAHAEGLNTRAGYASHSEGDSTIAFGKWSHAEGYDNKAYGQGSHVGGSNSETNVAYSFVSGLGLKSPVNNSEYYGQAIVGKYNDETSTALFMVGAGQSAGERLNAFEVLHNGTQASIKVGNTVITEAQLQALLNLL